MVTILDHEDQVISFFKNIKENDIIVLPILEDERLHAMNNKLCCVYVKLLNKDVSYIIPISHNESIGIYPWFFSEFKTGKNIYTVDKKRLLHVADKINGNVIDVSFLNYMKTNKSVDLGNCITPAHELIYRNFKTRDGLSSAIPLSCHIQWARNVSEILEKIIDENEQVLEDSAFLKYNTKVIETLSKVESNGIFISKDLFVEKFGTESEKHIANRLVFSEYNLLTSAGRPSNRFGGVNYAALNKSDGSRLPFVSRFGKDGILVLIDFESYHPRLIAKMIKYDLPTNVSVHNYLGSQFYGKENLTVNEYDDAKKKTFALLYGGVSEIIAKSIPYFKNVDTFINKFWEVSNSRGYFKSPIYKKKIELKYINDINKQKAFNYFLQICETENNIEIMSSINDFLKESVLIMYTYDSFLIDYKLSEGRGGLKELVHIASMGGEFPVRVYYGKDYHNMVDVTHKV